MDGMNGCSFEWRRISSSPLCANSPGDLSSNALGKGDGSRIVRRTRIIGFRSLCQSGGVGKIGPVL